MKNRDFREMRREEKRRKYEMKLLQRERDRARLKEERELAAARRRREEEQSAEEPTLFVGRMEYTRSGGIVYVDTRVLRDTVHISTPNMGGAQEGDKVVIRLLRKGNRRVMSEGEVVDVLGQDGENETEMHAILAEYGLPYSYPEEIEREAERIDAGITPDEVRRRRDMRSVLTFTIDPRDAKDFDDAISFRQLSEAEARNYMPKRKKSDEIDDSDTQNPTPKAQLADTMYEVGVHIADVTHYVRPGTTIDREGYARATSVYLVDRTIPMLPEHLSNGICSLRPDEDKLTFSVVFIMDEEAHVRHYDICRTVTRSDRRFAYEEAQAVLTAHHTKTADSAPLSSEMPQMVEALVTLDALAKKLRAKRFERGAIAFEREEVKFEIDEAGKPISVYYKKSEDANKLIEELMLLANRTVAAHVGKYLRKPFVYRIHDLPDPEKLKNLSQFIQRFGYNLKVSSTRRETVSKNINNLLSDVQGRAEGNMIETITVRAMAKAVYSTDNIGHYGLAFPYYTHFTSPIRRYPDMMVHRLLERYLAGGNPISEEEYESYCKHCSAREQLAASAERASIKYKQVEYMQEHLGETYTGIVSGVTEWGLYVEMDDNHCEGMVPVRDLLPHDYYEYVDKEYCLRGERTARVYTLGDKVTVRVERADLSRKQLDLVLVEEYEK